MKTRKRISLLLAICLLLSMTVPAVWAADEVTTYKFTSITAYKNLAFNGNIANGETTVIEDMRTQYQTGKRDWMYESSLVDSASISYSGTSSVLVKSTEVGEWIAFRIKAPSVGTYKVSVNCGYRNYGGKAALYILPAPSKETNTFTEDAIKGSPVIDEISFHSEDTSYQNPRETTSDTTWSSDGETEYILVFQITDKCGHLSNKETHEESKIEVAYMYLSSVSFTPASLASVGDEEFTDLSSAIIAASSAENKEVDLLANCTATDITIPAGVTLDLNGYTLTATEISSAGSIIDSSAESKGVLQGALTASGDNGGYLPVSAGKNTYKFYKVTVTASTAQTNAANTAKLKFQVKFENNAGYDALAAGTSGAAIGGSFAWAANTTPTMHDITYEGATLAEKWGQAVAANGYKDGSIVLTFSGLAAFEDLSVAPYIRNEETGVTISVDAVTLN